MRFLIPAFMLLLSCNLWAQWNAEPNFNGDKRFAAIDFKVNNNIYLLGGLAWIAGSYVDYDGLWKYDAVNKTWNKISTYPDGGIYGGVGFVIDSMVYVGLGANKTGVQRKEFWAYNTNDNTWKEIALFPGDHRTYGFSFEQDGKGYVGGGVSFSLGTSYLNDLWQYDPSINAWHQRKSYPGGGRVGMAALEVNGRSFVGMGDDDLSFFNDFYEYDAAFDQWTSRALFPGNNGSFYSVTSVYGKGYLIGGQNILGGYSKQFWMYNPSTNQWSSQNMFNQNLRGYGNLFFLDGSFYYGLGITTYNDNDMSDELFSLSATLSLETLADEHLSIYPNPVNSILNIDASDNQKINNVSIYNLEGQLLFETLNLENSQIDIQALNAGMYILQIKLGSETVKQKILIL